MIRILLALGFTAVLASCGADGDPITPSANADIDPTLPAMVQTA